MRYINTYKLSKFVDKQGKILYDKLDRIYDKLDRIVKIRKQNFAYGRWVAFIAAVISLAMLTSGIISIQWFGWSISCCTCLAWAYFARQDKDTPRMLMEFCFFVAALWGVHNWIGQS